MLQLPECKRTVNLERYRYILPYHKQKRKKTSTPVFIAKGADILINCAEVLKRFQSLEPFALYIQQNLEQVERLGKKRLAIREVLLQSFSYAEMSYRKLSAVLDGVDHVMYLNLHSIINKIAVFDYEEYQQLNQLEWNRDELAREKMDIYQTDITFVQQATRNNEEILLKLDRLLLEVTQFNSMKEDIMDMPAIKELDRLISSVRLYRQETL